MYSGKTQASLSHLLWHNQVDVGVNREALVQSPIVVIYISIVVIYVSITTPCGQLKKKKKWQKGILDVPWHPVCTVSEAAQGLPASDSWIYKRLLIWNRGLPQKYTIGPKSHTISFLRSESHLQSPPRTPPRPSNDLAIWGYLWTFGLEVQWKLVREETPLRNGKEN